MYSSLFELEERGRCPEDEGHFRVPSAWWPCRFLTAMHKVPAMCQVCPVLIHHGYSWVPAVCQVWPELILCYCLIDIHSSAEQWWFEL